MNLVRSKMHPELLVSENGDIYNADTGVRVNWVQNHGYTSKGYIVSYAWAGKHKTLSVAKLVYETHVKKDRLTSSDYVEFIDGDEFNCKASNLQCIRGRKKKPQSKKNDIEAYSTWMNGTAELYC